MENKLEQLLNSLIEKGWKPFGIAYYCSFNVREEIKILLGPFGGGEYLLHRTLSLRELVSKESELWQFVCENGMINVNGTEVYYFWLKRKGTLDRGYYYLSEASEDIRTNNFEYRLIESALKDESELESFILDNIKIGN